MSTESLEPNVNTRRDSKGVALRSSLNGKKSDTSEYIKEWYKGSVSLRKDELRKIVFFPRVYERLYVYQHLGVAPKCWQTPFLMYFNSNIDGSRSVPV